MDQPVQHTQAPDIVPTTNDTAANTPTDTILPDTEIVTQQMISARMNGSMTGEVPMKIRKALSKQDRVTVRMTQKQLT